MYVTFEADSNASYSILNRCETIQAVIGELYYRMSLLPCFMVDYNRYLVFYDMDVLLNTAVRGANRNEIGEIFVISTSKFLPLIHLHVTLVD